MDNKETLQINKTYCIEHTAAANETADSWGSGGLPVYATPAMIALMEHTSFTLAKQSGIDTVGTKVDISHLKACLTGTRLVCKSELIGIDGRRLVFKVCVTDGESVIGEGIHERFIIDPERFMSKLQK